MNSGHGRPISAVLRRLVSYLWPNYCCFCHTATNSAQDLCTHCHAHLPVSGQHPDAECAMLCLQCGKRLPPENTELCCSECKFLPSPFDELIVPYEFAYPVDQLIYAMKYRHNLMYARLLGTLLGQHAEVTVHPLPDALLPVPLHLSRQQQRGFNHADEIARWCGRYLGIPVLHHTASRIVDTGSLAGLGRVERSIEIRGAFAVSAEVGDMRIAIVDDVLTTGATAGELATELRDTGAAEVQLWTVARTPLATRAGDINIR